MFPQMVKIVPPGERGIARIEHFKVSDEDSRFSAIRREYVPAGKYARLMVGRELMMSDTPMEHRTNAHAARQANGAVLIGGLGMGMLLSAILPKREVSSVLVIEKHQDVIDLVAPHFPYPKLTVTHADILGWKPEKGTKFDTIYFDIWPDICTGNLDEIAKLHRRFKYYVNRSNDRAWMSSWCHDLLKSRRRQDSRNSYW